MAKVEFGDYMGRARITTVEEEITSANAIAVLEEIDSQLQTNLSQALFLDEYYRGAQEILSRQKTIRPDVNNKLVENRAYEIVNFKTGYQYGKGIFYVSRYNEDTNREKIERINMLNGIVSKEVADLAHLEDAFITGRGFRLVQVSEEEDIPYDIFRIDPRYGEMIYSNTMIPKKLGFVFVRPAETDDEEDLTVFYTPTDVITIYGDNVTTESHSLEEIPIIETVTNSRRMGAFEPVLGMLEAVNLLQSDRINAVEQFVQSLLVMVDVQFADDFDPSKLNEVGGIELKTPHDKPNAGIKFLTQEMNQESTQTLKVDFLQAINEITALPSRQQNSGGGDTGIAVEMREGWASAETFARKVDPYVIGAEMELVKLIVKCYNLSEAGEMLPNEVEVKFNRTPKTDVLSLTQAMLNQQEFGIDESVIIANAGIYGDPDEVYSKSKSILDLVREARLSGSTERTENATAERTDTQTQEE